MPSLEPLPACAGSVIVAPPEFAAKLPPQHLMPAEWGLKNTVRDLEIQLGTVEAYNRLVAAAKELKAKMDDGKADAPFAQYAARRCGAYSQNARCAATAPPAAPLSLIHI